MKERIYSLKGGKKIAFSKTFRPRDGDVVFFLEEEWRYIKQMGFTDEHKLFLWQAKFENFRYPIIPEKGLTEPEVVRKYCGEILKLFEGKKK